MGKLINKTQGYTVVAKNITMNRSLSLKAMGLLTLLLSLPDSWQFSVSGLSAICADGRESVSSGLAELESAGYLVRRQTQVNGRFAENDWIVRDTPEDAEKPSAENPSTEKPSAENHEQINTQVIRTDERRTEKKGKRGFAAPSANEVMHYAMTLDPAKYDTIDAEHFVDYYASKGWKVGSAPMKDWKAAVRNWCRRRERKGGVANVVEACFNF